MIGIVDVQLINSHKFVVYIHQIYSSLDLQLYVKIDPLVIIHRHAKLQMYKFWIGFCTCRHDPHA